MIHSQEFILPAHAVTRTSGTAYSCLEAGATVQESYAVYQRQSYSKHQQHIKFPRTPARAMKKLLSVFL